jgi:hypothetical protein
MVKVDFNGEPTKMVLLGEFVMLMSSVGLNYHGLDNISVNDRDTFEEKTNIAFEPIDGMIRLHDLNYTFED